MFQRDLKCAVTRRVSQRMAVVLCKILNAVNVRLRSRPSGSPCFSPVFVMLYRLNTLGLQKHASTSKKRGGLKSLGLNQRFPRYYLYLISLYKNMVLARSYADAMLINEFEILPWIRRSNILFAV